MDAVCRVVPGLPSVTLAGVVMSTLPERVR